MSVYKSLTISVLPFFLKEKPAQSNKVTLERDMGFFSQSFRVPVCSSSPISASVSGSIVDWRFFFVPSA